jgi:HSP20 family protein
MVPSIMAAPPGLLAGAFMSNPFEFMRRLNSEMDRLFESQLGGDVQESAVGAATWMPRIESVQHDNQLVVRAELPGLTKDDVTINVDDGTLEISGERRQNEEEQSDGSWWSERSYGSFYRAIPLPDGVNEDQITAKFENGILNVTVPLPQQATRKAKKIDIH